VSAILIAINIIAGLFLIGVVLLQSGKGADMGAAFGGANSTMFGPAGPGNALTKATAAFAALFMGTSLALAAMSARQESVFDGMADPVSSNAPITGSAGVPAPAAAPALDPEAAAEAAAAAAANMADAVDEGLANAGEAAGAAVDNAGEMAGDAAQDAKDMGANAMAAGEDAADTVGEKAAAAGEAMKEGIQGVDDGIDKAEDAIEKEAAEQ
jgi:preprotein translocase subunit SecG